MELVLRYQISQKPYRLLGADVTNALVYPDNISNFSNAANNICRFICQTYDAGQAERGYFPWLPRGKVGQHLAPRGRRKRRTHPLRK